MSKSLDELTHVEVSIKNIDGAVVYVLDTGSTIDAEASSMLQALHSRSVGGFKHHLEVLAKKGADKFMSSFYVGYGHKSIGDCGSAVLFIEGVSMLAAKAIQDWPLYSGQEASTRYIDFQRQAFINPAGTPEGDAVLERWRAFYVQALPVLIEDLKKRYPMGEGEKESVYDKAIAARAFDILRGALPAGASTNLAWHTNLRQAADKLMMLRHHPLEEVRHIADAIEEALQKAYPNSFHHKRYEGTEGYNEMVMKEDYYYHNPKSPEFAATHINVNTELLPKKVLEARPAKTELPKHLAEAGTVTFEFLLDFGSFRDVQRHRAVTQRMPLLTMDLGFHPWYLAELTSELRTKLEQLMQEQQEAIEKLNLSKEDKQYYIAMGYNTSNRMNGNLPALVYLAELRATRFVHPTLRERAQQIAAFLGKQFGDNGLVVHIDAEPDRFDVKRGEHDIMIKED